MLMSYLFIGMIALSMVASLLTGQGAALSAAVTQGGQSAITLTLSLAGSLCLWTGVGALMEKNGITRLVCRFLMPVLGKLFPDTKTDSKLAGSLSANVCANLLGLGNAATPMGIQAAKRLASHGKPGIAGDQLCRLIVLNTASIQLIPATVAAARSALGCGSPFDILPCVWVTSTLSAAAGLTAAWGFSKLWPQ